MLRTHHIPLLVMLLLAACGPGPSKGPKKTGANNADPNNVSSNNIAPNNANNVVTNNVVTNNNISPNVAEPCVTVSPMTLSFGNVNLGEIAEGSVTLENCSDSVAFDVSSIESPPGFEVFPPASAVQPLTTVNVPIVFAPEAPGAASGSVLLVTTAGSIAVSVQGMGQEPTEPCPVSVAQGRASAGAPWTATVVTVEGSTVELTAMNSTAQDTIVGWEWSIVTRPVGSAAELSSSIVQNPTFFVDLPGAYEIDLRALTVRTPETCPAARLRIDAGDLSDSEDILVQLVWNTPGDSNQNDGIGADLDLHYMHPLGTWNMPPYDCFWQNKVANWGADGTATVDLDDLDGLGPENITHANASATSFQIGVFYYNDNALGASTATVRVFRNAVQLAETDVSLTNQQFWLAGSFNAGTDAFTSLGTVTNGFP